MIYPSKLAETPPRNSPGLLPLIPRFSSLRLESEGLQVLIVRDVGVDRLPDDARGLGAELLRPLGVLVLDCLGRLVLLYFGSLG